MPDPYLSLAQFREALGHPDAVDQEDLILRAIDAASRQIDEWAKSELGTDRHFWPEPAPVARVFYPRNRYLVDCGFFSTLVGVVVKTDDDLDGVFETTWTTSQWRPEPVALVNGRPHTQIVATGRTRLFPVNGRRPAVQITAKWGWVAVPGPIEQACQILAMINYKSKDFTGGQVGFDDESGPNDPSSPYRMAQKMVYDLTGKRLPAREAA